MYVKLAFLIIFSIVLTGCSTLNVSEYKDPSIDTKRQLIRTPQLNQVNKVEIGENLYQKIYQHPSNQYDAILLENNDISMGKDRNYYWLALGLVGAAIMEVSADNVEMKMESKTSEQPKSFELMKTDDGYAVICPTSKICLIDKNFDGFFTHYSKDLSNNIDILDASIPYKKKLKAPAFNEGDFKYVALYQGRIGNKIKLSFREFAENMARPAFTQDVEYELDENGQALVGFKGLRLFVIKATNFDISYKVTEDFK